MNNAEVLIKFKGDTKDVDKSLNNTTTSLGKLTKAFTLGSLASKGITKGIEVFTASLDGAVSRIDTMNNFPKVMSNLGISAKESEEVIKDLSKQLQGLPTTLDSAAQSVQRFTSKNGDVKKSEQVFLAVNNAILAGGAPTEQQASALEQLSQAYAKGKPDMMEWRSMMSAMPAQLTQVAKAMGYVNADALGEALRSGKVSMDDFTNTMVEMNTKGVNGFKSFSEQAKNSTNGLQTSITNMKTAFVRGVANIISQIDKSLSSIGGLSGVINYLGKVGEKVFGGIGSIVGEIMPMLLKIGKKIMPTISKAFNSLKPALTQFATALLPAIQKVLDALLPAFTRIIEKLMPLLVKIINVLTPLLEPLADFLVSYIDLFMTGLEPALDILIAILNPLVDILGVIIKVVLQVLTAWNKLLNGIEEGVQGTFKKVIDFFKNNWQGILLFLVNPFAGAFKLIYDNCEGFRNIVNNVINSVKGFFSGLWTNMKNGATSAWNGIKSVFSTVANFFKSIFTNAWNAVKAVFSTGGKVFTGIKEGIVKAFKSIVNTLIDGINKVVSIPFKGINETLKKIKNVNILGKKPFSGLVKTVSVPKIPHLNTGTNYVPDDTLAMIHKGEAVVPKKFNPYASPSNSMYGAMNNSRSKQVINVYANFKQDNLGQIVRDIKTFSGGARNDYNYGAGV